MSQIGLDGRSRLKMSQIGLNDSQSQRLALTRYQWYVNDGVHVFIYADTQLSSVTGRL